MFAATLSQFCSAGVCGFPPRQAGVACPYPLVSALSAGVVLLGKVPQVVVVVEVKKLHQILKRQNDDSEPEINFRMREL